MRVSLFPDDESAFTARAPGRGRGPLFEQLRAVSALRVECYDFQCQSSMFQVALTVAGLFLTPSSVDLYASGAGRWYSGIVGTAAAMILSAAFHSAARLTGSPSLWLFAMRSDAFLLQ